MITSLKVRNFKSLENVELKLNGLHVLVGANGSGKSNLFDVFQFLRELAVVGESAVHSRGGFAQLVWGGDLKRTMGFELHTNLSDEKTKPARMVYQLEIAGGPLHANITKEQLTLLNGKGKEQPLLIYPAEDGRAIAKIFYSNGRAWEASRMQGRLLLHYLEDEERCGVAAKFVKQLQSWANYNFEPSTMRRPNTVKQDYHLQRSGENFSSVLHSVQSEHAAKFSEIENLLKTALPQTRRLFTALTKDSQTFASLEEEAFSLKIPAWAMSDGTLRLLAQLAASFSPQPPALSCFEEPENFLHPAWLVLVADVLKSAAGQSQIMVSTHSPYLLNFFSPEHLLIVEKEEGKSLYKSLRGRKGLKEALRVLGLGELWYSGELGGMP